MKKLLIILTILFFGCNNTYVTEIKTGEHTFTYMYLNQYDFDGQIGTASDIIVVDADNLTKTNSGARQIADVGEYEEDFDNYVDDYGNTITANDQYLIDNCWGIGDFSIQDKDVEGDGMVEQVFGGSIVPTDCNGVSFADAVDKTIKPNAQLNFVYIGSDDNVKLNVGENGEDRLDYFTMDGNGQRVVGGHLMYLWANDTITITHEAQTGAKITLLGGEDLTLYPNQGIVVEREESPAYNWKQVGEVCNAANSIKFYSRPFNITDDVSIKLEDLLVETNERVHVDVYLTWEDGTLYGDGTPVYSGDLMNGLNVKPPEDVKGFYTIDIDIPEPVYYVRFQFVFTVVDTDGQPSGVWIDGFHVEGSADLNTGSCDFNSLPIEITKFYAIKEGDLINIYITTATELIADYMEFYGSDDGKNWTTIEDRIPCDNLATGSHYHLIYNTLNGSLIRQ